MLLVRLPRPIDCRGDRFRSRVRRAAKAARRDPSHALARFAFRCDERSFAEEILTRSTQLWLYRTDQTQGCGDFLVVDMSPPDLRARRVWAIELKLGADLGRSAGLQLRRADDAGALLERRGVARAHVQRLMGGRQAVLAHLRS